MLDAIRYALAVGLFCLGGYLLFDLVATGFNLAVLLGAVASLALAHYVRPKNRADDDSVLLDILDAVIDLPFRAVATLLRSLGRSSSSDIGVD